MSKGFKFIDSAKIFIKAGDGGNGHCSFRRERYVPKGGPDGGNGGRGGNIVLIGSTQLATLQDFRYQRHYRAKDGQDGGKSQCTGANGPDLEIRVPLGTLVVSEDHSQVLGEVLEDAQRVIIAEGGRGGRGNMNYASSINRAPRKCTPGEKREGQWVEMELRVLADVGIVGPPNVGKSTLLSRLTAAKPKVADYPFTTLVPGLGVLQERDKPITLADIPGLIEGAHEGLGLGTSFLKHIQRTRLLLYVTTVSEENPESAWTQFSKTRTEILHHDASAKSKPFVVALNKIDILEPQAIKDIVCLFNENGIEVFPVSAKEETGLKHLTQKLYEYF